MQRNRPSSLIQADRLAEVQENDIPIGNYVYSADGKRTRKVADGQVTVYHYDHSGHLIGESDGQGNLTRLYIYLNGVPLAQITVDTGSENAYYYHTDHLGTPQRMTDATGTIVWAADYLPFGDVDITVEMVENNLRFAGQYYDSETELHYNYHRYYDPRTGRYLAPDPIGLAGEINSFGYVINNPVNWIDPWGLDRYSDTVTVATSVVDVGVAYAKPPTTPAGAVLFSISILADKANALLAFTPDGKGKAISGTVLSAVGTTAAIASSNPLSVLLSSYGLGTAINNLPVYASNKTIGEWWVDYIWDKLHNEEGNCEN